MLHSELNPHNKTATLGDYKANNTAYVVVHPLLSFHKHWEIYKSEMQDAKGELKLRGSVENCVIGGQSLMGSEKIFTFLGHEHIRTSKEDASHTPTASPQKPHSFYSPPSSPQSGTPYSSPERVTTPVTKQQQKVTDFPSVDTQVTECKHRCRDKRNCGHQCCKRHLK